MSVKEFLSQPAVNITIGGQYTLANRFDSRGKLSVFACRTSRVSPFRMMIAVPVVGKIGDRLTAQFAEFGKLQGQIKDIVPGTSLVDLEMTPSMREKFANESVCAMICRSSSCSAADSDLGQWPKFCTKSTNCR